ncbi:ABC transporter permease [Pseudooceanicola sp. CBS1P-1]|uniref:ABC transporter permease n=1 Tax=Pseudooceanicola albus TaxID=2692189 RepID=A0A6L7G285_9RHOB|nr:MULTISPECIES: ABC transporter permease [Pseudooceanicola]MBT9383894.1 ABC transporter permease [Pseudooceanicola endophyticus]MXN16693.1 ABC transporter permease [Pseudooceanicola albus]
MFEKPVPRSTLQSALSMAELIFHSTAHDIRKTHRSALFSLLNNLLRVAVMMSVFYLMFLLFGLRNTAIRGDFLLFMLSGVFLYRTHVQTVSAVMGASSAFSAMRQHRPINTLVALASSALSALYIQVLCLFIILVGYHLIHGPFEIYQPLGAFGCILVAWGFGIAVGVAFAALKPWAPTFANILSQFYRRANMIASGKMFVVNTLPTKMRDIFDWNPLFHTIDQTRGHVFINYVPHFTSLRYAIWVSVVIFCLAMIGEFYTRRHVSASWKAR